MKPEALQPFADYRQLNTGTVYRFLAFNPNRPRYKWQFGTDSGPAWKPIEFLAELRPVPSLAKGCTLGELMRDRAQAPPGFESCETCKQLFFPAQLVRFEIGRFSHRLCPQCTSETMVVLTRLLASVLWKKVKRKGGGR